MTLILITRPQKKNDPTQYTYFWGEEAVKFAKSLGYDVVDIQKDDNNYEHVTKMIEKYKPRLYVHFGHGCGTSLQGQIECIVTKKFTVNELLKIADNNFEEFKKLVTPASLSCNSSDELIRKECQLEDDICSPICMKDTNVHLLKNTISIAFSCHSALKLGKCAIVYGAQTYVGYDDLLMFAVDNMGSQNIFGDVQLVIYKELLMGKSIKEAEKEMRAVEDAYIKMYKKIKYLALPMLWNQKARRILGDLDARIYD